MKFIKSVSLISLLTLSINVMAEGEKSLSECGFPLAGEKFESNLKELLDVSTTPPEIPDYKCETDYRRYASLCRALELNRTIDDQDSPYSYEHEVELAKLAQTNPDTDGETLFIQKINTYVSKCAKTLVCDTTRTQKKQISLMKVAVTTANWEFLEQAIRVYKYPLDIVDSYDNMNILDYVYEDYKYYLERFPALKETSKLKTTYQMIKDAGGKHYKYPPSTIVK